MTETTAPEVADEVVDRAEISNGNVLVAYSRTEAAIAELKARYSDVRFDLTTTAGDRAARAARLELVRLRTSLDSKRKDFKAPALEFGRRIDSEADAQAEGIAYSERFGGYCVGQAEHFNSHDPRQSYFSLWEAINGPGSVEANPWVWVVAFGVSLNAPAHRPDPAR